jgi:putative spermidine/putrescine transport system substrate-binding protein
MISRRSLLASAAAAAALPTRARAAGQVVVGTWGGDYAELLGQNIEKPILAPMGIDVVPDIGSPDSRKTKLTAERASRRSSMDVVHLSDTDMYNPDKVKAPPKGFADLWDPQWKGRVAIPDGNYTSVVFGAALVAGGSMSNWEPARRKLLDLKGNDPKIYPSHELLAQAMKAEEVWITPMWLARGYMWKQAGLKLAHVVPEEGTIPVVFEAAVTKNAQNKANGWAYLNAMLDARAQGGFSARMGYVPTVTNAKLDAELEREISFTPEQTERFRTPDYAYQAKSNPDIFNFWNKEFKA